ncbi:hypothetical protein CEXT_531301 [Caerostris extrusa]|uniref:Uncharacterized protein n=1 Tax=Caerostris extrusa TaxID=172846 RepID=A0AAV4TEV1_CAEEX|nr:hypothetical protein CEXT_531301 [Caerostris extrusa]
MNGTASKITYVNKRSYHVLDMLSLFGTELGTGGGSGISGKFISMINGNNWSAETGLSNYRKNFLLSRTLQSSPGVGKEEGEQLFPQKTQQCWRCDLMNGTASKISYANKRSYHVLDVLSLFGVLN